MSDIRDSGCCGATFEREHISLFALLTVSFPLVLLGTPLQPLLTLGGEARFAVLLRALHAANIRVIRDTHILPKLRCDLGARLFPISPALAGFSFKAFNLVLLGLVWLGTGSAVAVIMEVIA